MSASLDERFGPLLGESVWHTVNVDPTLQEVSELHFNAVQDILARHGQHLPFKMVSLDGSAAPPYAQVSLTYVGAVSL